MEDQQAPVSPPISPPHHSKFLPIALCGLVLVVLAVFLGFFAGNRKAPSSSTKQPSSQAISNTPLAAEPEAVLQNTTKWKSYLATQDRLSFQYPSEWYSQFRADEPCEKCGGTPRGLYIQIIENSSNTSALVYAQNDLAKANKNLNPPIAKILPKPSYASALDMVIANGFPGAGSPGLQAYVAKNSYIYLLKFEGIDDMTAHTLLSTLRFY